MDERLEAFVRNVYSHEGGTFNDVGEVVRIYLATRSRDQTSCGSLRLRGAAQGPWRDGQDANL